MIELSDRAIVVMVGLPGSGKTSLASQLAALTGAVVISRDTIKRALFGMHDVGTRQNALAFQVMKLAIPVTVDLAPLVILDGMPFSRIGQVEDIEAIASSLEVRCLPLLVDCPLSVAQQRLVKVDACGPADRDPKLVARVASEFRPIPEAWFRVDANRVLDVVCRDAMAILQAEGIVA